MTNSLYRLAPTVGSLILIHLAISIIKVKIALLPVTAFKV